MGSKAAVAWEDRRAAERWGALRVVAWAVVTVVALLVEKWAAARWGAVREAAARAAARAAVWEAATELARVAGRAAVVMAATVAAAARVTVEAGGGEGAWAERLAVGAMDICRRSSPRLCRGVPCHVSMQVMRRRLRR